MNKDGEGTLSETALNVVENLAYRIAEKESGRITPAHLIPYLPMSLGVIKDCLDNLAEGDSVSFERGETGLLEYVFHAHRDAEKIPGLLTVNSCVSCDADIRRGREVLCANCARTVKKELNKLAEKTGWPVKAVYEHEILYLAGKNPPPHYAGVLAGHSSITLRRMRGKLDALCLDGFATQDIDPDKGLVRYHFPSVDYPKEFFRANMEVIRGYPSSVMEEVEIKVVRILLTLSALVACFFVVSFLFHVPFVIMIGLLLVVGPILSLIVWTRKQKPLEE